MGILFLVGRSGEVTGKAGLDLCPVKSLRFPKQFCVVLDLLLSEGDKIAFFIFTHDEEDTRYDVTTQPAIAF